MKYLLIQHVCGFDVIKAVIDLAVGEKPHVGEVKKADKITVNECLGGLVRKVVILVGYLALSYLKLLHHLVYKLDGVLKRSVASYLHHHRNLSELRLLGAVNEVVLINIEFLRIKVEVNDKSLTLDVKLNELNSALIEGLVIPAATSLDSLIGKNVILNLGVEVLNILGRLDKSGHEASVHPE